MASDPQTAEVGVCDDCGRSIPASSETCADCLGDDRGTTLADFGGEA